MSHPTAVRPQKSEKTLLPPGRIDMRTRLMHCSWALLAHGLAGGELMGSHPTACSSKLHLWPLLHLTNFLPLQ